MSVFTKRGIAATICLSGVLAAASSRVNATGTMSIQQRDGSIKTYKNVSVRVNDANIALISSDGNGMLVVGKSACTKVGELLRCFAYDATLDQYGDSYHIRLQSGTVWLNPTTNKQPLSYSSTQLPPRGVQVSIRTRAGTYVSLTGTVDEMRR